jgi:hypothetical protein
MIEVPILNPCHLPSVPPRPQTQQHEPLNLGTLQCISYPASDTSVNGPRGGEKGFPGASSASPW